MNTLNNCSNFFTYKDIIECGETLSLLKDTINNNPVELETYRGIEYLCKNILDPVTKKFGNITLTYGFASANLTKHIKGRIFPMKDQHSGFEKKKNGEYICARLGQSVDFYIENISSREIGRWISENTPFDRLYFYGDQKPIHVSAGPENNKQIIEMRDTDNSNRKIPLILKNL